MKTYNYIYHPSLCVFPKNNLFPSDFPTKILYTPLIYPHATWHEYLFSIVTPHNILWEMQIIQLHII